jgi:hypothetical protein
MTTQSKDRRSLSHLAKAMIERYEFETRGARNFMTETIKGAMLCKAMWSLMADQYGVDRQSGQDKIMDAYREAFAYLFPEDNA